MGAVESCLACDQQRTATTQNEKSIGARKPLGSIDVNSVHHERMSSKASVASSTLSTGGMCKVGIGAYFERSKDDENLLKVKSVLRGSPASGSGVIAVGDVIVAVDGEDMYGSSLAGLADKLLGLPDTVVSVSLRRGSDGKEYSVELTRGIKAASGAQT